MSAWTHNICEDCWNVKHPDRKAVKLIEAEEDDCCYCGKKNANGIYLRDDPATLHCKGEHK